MGIAAFWTFLPPRSPSFGYNLLTHLRGPAIGYLAGLSISFLAGYLSLLWYRFPLPWIGSAGSSDLLWRISFSRFSIGTAALFFLLASRQILPDRSPVRSPRPLVLRLAFCSVELAGFLMVSWFPRSVPVSGRRLFSPSLLVDYSAPPIEYSARASFFPLSTFFNPLFPNRASRAEPPPWRLRQ